MDSEDEQEGHSLPVTGPGRGGSVVPVRPQLSCRICVRRYDGENEDVRISILVRCSVLAVVYFFFGLWRWLLFGPPQPTSWLHEMFPITKVPTHSVLSPVDTDRSLLSASAAPESVTQYASFG